MEIDIISYTPSQFSLLSSEQLLQVQEAQMKKNALLRKLEDELQKEKEKLIENGMLHAGIWAKVEQQLKSQCDEEIAWVRDTLLFYLQYAGADELVNVPYNVDYTLSIEERLEIVKAYYYQTYTEPLERLNTYAKDKVAMQYLGEVYSLLYDYMEADL